MRSITEREHYVDVQPGQAFGQLLQIHPGLADRQWRDVGQVVAHASVVASKIGHPHNPGERLRSHLRP